MEQFFKNPETLLRLHEGPLGAYIESFAKLLTDQGYAQCSVRSYLRLVADFSRWLEQQRVIVEEITPEHIKQYFEQPHHPSRRGYAFTLQRFLDFLCQQGAIPQKTTPILQTPVELLADEFRSYLRQERALAETTLIYYMGFISRFLKDRFADGEVDLSALCAADVVGFVERQTTSLHRKRAKVMTTALRSFLQYARYRGALKMDLASAVPTVANWAMASIPRFLSPDQIELVLARCNRQTAVGCRDYAILLLLARLGLRGGEVVALTLDDIDWEAGYISVCGKGGQRTTLPLPVDVGEAIAAYLKNGRPSSANRHLFLRSRAPAVGFRGPVAISSLVMHALRRAGIDAPHKGAHLFRHSLATGMLGHGASLAEIGELLRHRSPQTTTIYAKVDLGSLRTLALPWPGGSL
jgi:site-specific recombinase XerD